MEHPDTNADLAPQSLRRSPPYNPTVQPIAQRCADQAVVMKATQINEKGGKNTHVIDKQTTVAGWVVDTSQPLGALFQHSQLR